jgi:glycosyltransferase involved in cell wall biosynthesis
MGNPVVGTLRRAVRWDYRMQPRIAWLSPMPPARTGIATYSRAVLDGLERIGYTKDRHAIQPIWPLRPRHEGTIPWHTMGVYHLGNNVEFHRDVYRHAIQTPGLLVIHDLALDDFVRGMIVAGDPLGHQAMREGVANAPRLIDLPDAVTNEPLRVPLVAHVARRARGVVVHSPFVERYLRAFGCRTPVYVAPHPVVEKEADVARALGRRDVVRGRLEVIGMRSLVGVLGDLNEAKQIDAVLAAAATLPEDVHVALVGRRIEGYDVEPVVRASGLGSRVHLHHDVADDEFLEWIAAVDIAVDLRFPHRGEVSGSLARCMQLGRPTLVSATGTYLDIPVGLVARVSPGRTDSDEIAGVLRDLLERDDVRLAMGGAAREHMLEQARTEATARAYAEAIDGTLALLRDPTRRVLARWGGALVDLGVTEEALAEGYGLSYARALDDFVIRPSRG